MVAAKYSRHARLMGTHFELIVVAGSERDGHHYLDKSIAEIQRLEALLTEFHPHSQTSLLNTAGHHQPVRVLPEVYDLVIRSLHISAISQGAFDITVGPLKKLYDFKKPTAAILPAPTSIRQAKEAVGHQYIHCTPPDIITLGKPGMRLSFAA